MTGFSETAWREVEPVYRAVLDHPFVRCLGDGSLDEQVFARYLLDDAHYLVAYARTLATIAARMPTAEGVAQLAGAAVGAVTAEREMHRSYLEPRGIDVTGGEPTPTCRAYTGFLAQQAAFAPVEVAMAAVLPCFRVYAEVGRAIAASRVVGDHPYAQWIDAYADPAFAEAVAAAEATTDALAVDSSHAAAMLEAYSTATRFE